MTVGDRKVKVFKCRFVQITDLSVTHSVFFFNWLN